MNNFFCKLTLTNGEHINVVNSKDGLLDQDVVNAALLMNPKSYIERAEIGKECNEIGFHAFFGCVNMREVVIPNTVTAIGASAFFNCGKLPGVFIPRSVTLIENYAFDGCVNMREVVIPNSVKIIRRKAFNACVNLVDVTMKSSTPPELTGASAFDYTTCPIYVPEKSVSKYKKNKYWRVYADRITARK